ncbi:M23 family metallopeptidase [Bacillus gobiensis]|uniref:M23 family metallopeptidase n=1 Tax=Bacillus gobiensis TaxID=1441095 RepID=UPI0009E70B2F|nr:M23 family metallopeptidase [Bacillus gobiensis]
MKFCHAVSLLISGILLLCLVVRTPFAIAEESKGKDWIQPVKGELTDLFGTREGKHKGIDIAASEGEEIRAVDDGVVEKSYYSSSYGHVIFLAHEDGYETVYAHLSKRMYREGEKVKRGEVIGIIGNTGISTGTHLHFEVHRGNWTPDKRFAVDPLHMIKKDQFQEQTVPVQAKTSVNNKKLMDVTVKKGDTLWSIAKEHHSTVVELMKINELKSAAIAPGDKLFLSAHGESTRMYVVKKGDTLFSVANKNGMSVQKLQRMNNLKTTVIHMNQKLYVITDPI